MDKNRFIKWLQRYRVHLLVWASITVVHILISPFRGPHILPEIVTAFVSVGYVVVFYGSGLIVFPHFKNNRILAGIGSLLLLSAFFFLFSWIIWYVFPDMIGVRDNRPQGVSLKTDIFNISLNLIIGIFAGYGYFLHCVTRWRIRRNNELEAKQLKIEREKIETEKKLLKTQKELIAKHKLLIKNQFNEHTTFNFFNTLYLSLYKNDQEAANAILLFSDFLEYTLKLQVNQMVTLQDEIKHINNYLEIQKILKKRIYFQFEQEGPFDGIKIQALTLFTIVENAFKHGVFNDPENPIKLTLEVNGRINFSVTNLKNGRSVRSTGIGQSNLKEMLEIAYPEAYNLNVNDNGNIYNTTLALNYD